MQIVECRLDLQLSWPNGHGMLQIKKWGGKTYRAIWGGEENVL